MCTRCSSSKACALDILKIQNVPIINHVLVVWRVVLVILSTSRNTWRQLRNPSRNHRFRRNKNNSIVLQYIRKSHSWGFLLGWILCSQNGSTSKSCYVDNLQIAVHFKHCHQRHLSKGHINPKVRVFERVSRGIATVNSEIWQVTLVVSTEHLNRVSLFSVLPSQPWVASDPLYLSL